MTTVIGRVDARVVMKLLRGTCAEMSAIDDFNRGRPGDERDARGVRIGTHPLKMQARSGHACAALSPYRSGSERLRHGSRLRSSRTARRGVRRSVSINSPAPCSASADPSIQRAPGAGTNATAVDRRGGGWKIDGLLPVGRWAGSSIVVDHGDRIGKTAGVFRSPHRSECSASGMIVESGTGSRLEQPGPEQGAGDSGVRPGWRSRPCSAGLQADDPPSSNTRRSWWIAHRWERIEPGWRQPAWAVRDARKPWKRSSSTAAIPQRPHRSKPMRRIEPPPTSLPLVRKRVSASTRM